MTPTNPPLRLTLSVPTTSPSATHPTIALTVTNTSPSTTYTLLSYSSPLDPLTLQLGLLSLTLLPTPSSSPTDLPSSTPPTKPELGNGFEEKPLPLNTILIKRLIPPPHDAFITLEPGQTTFREVILQQPTVDTFALELQGKRVRVTWTGRGWGAEGGTVVFEGGREEVLKGVVERGEGWEEGAGRWFPDGGEGVEVLF